MSKLFDFVHDVSHKKQGLVRQDPDNEKDLQIYPLNLALSMNIETVAFANEVNKMWDLPKIMQYDFLFYGIPKRFRKFQWAKKTKVEDVELVQRYFECNFEKAMRYMRILSKEDIEEIRQSFDTGGRR